MTHTSVTCTHTLCALHSVCHIKEIAECCSVHNEYAANLTNVMHAGASRESRIAGSRNNGPAMHFGFDAASVDRRCA